jgi:plastocyanin
MRNRWLGRASRSRIAAQIGLVVATIALALVAVACGASASPSPVATNTVDLPRSYRFSPAAITVKAGTTVTWTNNDNFTHNVTFPGEESKTMAPGAQATRDFPTAGTFNYMCTLHPQDMKGTVIVTAS